MGSSNHSVMERLVFMTKPLIVVALLIAIPASALAAVRAERPPGMSAARATAIHDCNVEAARFSQPTWGVQQISVYRSCMARKDQSNQTTLIQILTAPFR